MKCNIFRSTDNSLQIQIFKTKTNIFIFRNDPNQCTLLFFSSLFTYFLIYAIFNNSNLIAIGNRAKNAPPSMFYLTTFLFH